MKKIIVIFFIIFTLGIIFFPNAAWAEDYCRCSAKGILAKSATLAALGITPCFVAPTPFDFTMNDPVTYGEILDKVKGSCGAYVSMAKFFTDSKILDQPIFTMTPELCAALSTPRRYELNTMVGGELIAVCEATDENLKITQLSEELKKPSLEIRIPGLNFSNAISTSTDADGNVYVSIPSLAEYITAIYKFAMVVASILGVVMVIVVGVKIVVSMGGEEKVQGYKRIAQIVIGLALVWGSYFILFNINPDLVNFRVLKVRYIVGKPFEDFNKNPDDNPEGGQFIPPTTPFSTAELVKYQGKGCGKNLPQIAQTYANQQICEGPIHCANFVSRVLSNSGCDASFTNNKAGDLAIILQAKGWKLIKGNDGAQAGDILFWGTDKPGHHTAISLGGKNYIDSNSSNMDRCWPKNVAYSVKTSCGDFLKNYFDKNVSVEAKKQYSACVAARSGCAPTVGVNPASCNYCAKLGPISEFENTAKIKYQAASYQCIASNSNQRWSFYFVNPNK